jgi:hypothetical protein
MPGFAFKGIQWAYNSVALSYMARASGCLKLNKKDI